MADIPYLASIAFPGLYASYAISHICRVFKVLPGLYAVPPPPSLSLASGCQNPPNQS